MAITKYIRNTYWGFLLKRCWYKFRHKSLSANQQMTEDDFNLGWALYNRIDAHLVKPKRQVINELNRLYKYWHCFPDTYFRFGMFLRECTDWARMTSFLPQIAAVRYENSGACREYGILLDDKILFNELLSSYGFPVPHVYFRFMHNRFFVHGTEQTDNQIESLLQTLPVCRIFAKPSTGSCAKGISVISKSNDGLFSVVGDVNSPKMCGGGVISLLRSLCGDDDYQFEAQLIQDKQWVQFCPDTINTIRVLTINPTYSNEIIVGAAARFGRMGGYVDNLAQGGVAVNIDIHTGELGEYGLREYDLTKYTEHPDTHRVFAHYKVPYWEQLRDLIHRVSIVMPPLRMIGWDIALTETGPVIVEMNTGTGVYSVQMGSQLGIADYFKGYIPTYA